MISFDYDYDIEWLKLKYAYAKLNYTTVDTSKIGVKYEDSASNRELKNSRLQKDFTNQKLSDSIQKNLSDLKGKAGKVIKICDIPCVSNGVVSLNIIVQLKISVSGEVSLVVTTSNAKGIEYKNGNIRYIKEEKKDTDVKISAKAELTLYIGAAFKALGLNIVGFGMEGGIGAKGSVIIHLIDQERHLLTEVNTGVDLNVTEQEISSIRGLSVTSEKGKSLTLNAEICLDYKVYGILKITLDTESVIGKIFKGTEIEIFGEKNATIEKLSGHIEDGVNVKKCTREFSIEDDEEEMTDNNQEEQNDNNQNNVDEEDDTILNAEYLDIDTYFVNLSIGESYTIKIEKIPAGYKQSDIIFKSSNESVISVDSSGKIKALDSGSASVSVQTKDGKYKQECSVFVISSESNSTFVPLSYSIEMTRGYSI